MAIEAVTVLVIYRLAHSSQNGISTHVIGKIAKSNFASGSHQADGTYDQGAGPHCLNTEHMLNARPYLRPHSVSPAVPLSGCRYWRLRSAPFEQKNHLLSESR